jgi:hypothetical protein
MYGLFQSLRLDVGRAYHFSPFIGVLDDQLVEQLAKPSTPCCPSRGAAQRSGISEARIDLLIELIDF